MVKIVVTRASCKLTFPVVMLVSRFRAVSAIVLKALLFEGLWLSIDA